MVTDCCGIARAFRSLRGDRGMMYPAAPIFFFLDDLGGVEIGSGWWRWWVVVEFFLVSGNGGERNAENGRTTCGVV